MNRVSLQGIADQLRISRATVSKVVNKQPGVALKTRRKVVQSLTDNGYNKFDSTLLELLPGTPAEPTADQNVSVRGQIAVVVTEPHFSAFWVEIINGIASFLDEKDCHLVYHFLARDDEQRHILPQTLHKQMQNSDLRGMIVLNIYDGQTIAKLEALRMPTVFLDTCPTVAVQRSPGLRGDLVLLEGYKSLLAITQTLIEQGLRSLGFIGDIHYSESIRHRWSGFAEALSKHDIPLRPEYCLLQDVGRHFYEQQPLFSALQQLERQPRAWVCANDSIAYMVLTFLRGKGLKTPEDVMVTGFDKIPSPLTEALSLTTVRVDAHYIGQRLASQLLLRLQFPEMPFEVVHIEPEVVYGASTGCHGY